MDEQEKTRTHMIRFTSCENVLVQGVTLLNSPKFHIIPTRCKNVIIDGITVKCPWNAQNGDAIDISSCKEAKNIDAACKILLENVRFESFAK